MNNRSVPFLMKCVVKIGKLLAKGFPLLRVRIIGLKMCGFEIGKKVYVAQDLIIASTISDKSCYLKIGDRVSIGPRVTIILASDANWSRLMERFQPIRGSVVLNNDCWIGAGAIILPNVTIGECSIIGAGSVVTKNVAPYTIVTGVPAKELRKIDR